MTKSSKVKTKSRAEHVHKTEGEPAQIALVHTDGSVGFYDASNVGDIGNFARQRIGKAVATLEIEGESIVLLLDKAGLECGFSSGLPPNPVAQMMASSSCPICGDAVAVGRDPDGGYTGLKTEHVDWLKENAPVLAKMWRDELAAMGETRSDVAKDDKAVDGMTPSGNLGKVPTMELVKELVRRKMNGDEDCLIIRLYTKEDLKNALEQLEYPVTEENVSKFIERIEFISQMIDCQESAAFQAAIEAFCEKEDDKSDVRKRKRKSRAKGKTAGGEAAISPESENGDCEG